MAETIPDTVGNDELKRILAAAVRLYAARAEANAIDEPFERNAVTATDVMITVTEMMDAVNVQLFELGMWQAMTGACIPQRHRMDPGSISTDPEAGV